MARKSEKITREKAEFYLNHWADFTHMYGNDADLLCREFQYKIVPSEIDEIEDTLDKENLMWVAVFPEDLEDHREEDGSMCKEWKNFEVWFGR